MAEETVNVVDVPVTVDPATAEDRGDNFTPNDDAPVLDNDGNSIDTTAAPAPAPAPAPADGAEDDEQPGPEGGGRIPKARFNEVNNARKLAEARADLLAAELARLQAGGAPTQAPAPAGAPAAPAFDVKAQERAYADAMLEGDVDRALEIRDTINSHIMEVAEQRASQRVNQDMTQRQAANALQAASNQAVIDFPYLDTPEGSDALELILMARDRDMATGVPAHLALSNAVAKIAPRFAPAGTNTPSRDSTAGKPPVDTRTANAMARGAQDSNLQPPAIVNGIGNRATQGKVDVSQLSEAQFEALSPDEKKRMRGD
jgi:hypothetical protein